jgi:hypothetical protein
VHNPVHDHSPSAVRARIDPACSGGVAGVGGRRGRLASGAAAITGVVPCDQDDDCQHACQGERRCLQPPTGSCSRYATSGDRLGTIAAVIGSVCLIPTWSR